MTELLTPPATGNLPTHLSLLIGREREVAAVSASLRDPETRLLTLTGPGGVGKTRLALAAARAMGEVFPDGVWFVALAATSDPALVPTAVGAALDVRESGGHTVADRLLTALRGRRLLLVLDNFEQVVDAAPFVAELLTACLGVTALLTSRMGLRVSGESQIVVAPLPVVASYGAAGDALDQVSDAVRLFAARAVAVNADFVLTAENVAVVSDICTRLDGLPLAIELAAAWVKVLSPRELLARLDQRLPLLTGGGRELPVRQQTMRNTIAWSHNLLSPEERALFRRLAIFVGGFSLEAAEAIGNPPHGPDVDVLTGLAALVDLNLVRRGEAWDGAARFSMLETVREFGMEQLAGSGEYDDIAARHAAFFLRQVELASLFEKAGGSTWTAAERASTQDRAAIDRQIEQEHDNQRAAVDRLAATGQGEACLELTVACAPFWQSRGHLRESQTRLDRALAMVGDQSVMLRAQALLRAGYLAISRGDVELAATHARAALPIWSVLADARGEAYARMLLATVEENLLHWQTASELYEAALTTWRRLEDPGMAGLALSLLGGIAYAEGQYERATALQEEAHELSEAADDPIWAAMTVWYRGLVAVAKREFLKAARHYRASLTALTELGDVEWLFKPLLGLAAVAAHYGHPESAARLLGAVDALLQRTGGHLFPFDLPGHALAETTARAALGEERFQTLQLAGGRLTQVELLAEADAIVAVAEEAVRAPRRRGADPSSGLTTREIDILRLVSAGKSDRQIADILCISHRTVNTHVASIRNQLGVHSRQDAVERARDLGLLPATSKPPSIRTGHATGTTRAALHRPR